MSKRRRNGLRKKAAAARRLMRDFHGRSLTTRWGYPGLEVESPHLQLRYLRAMADLDRRIAAHRKNPHPKRSRRLRLHSWPSKITRPGRAASVTATRLYGSEAWSHPRHERLAEGRLRRAFWLLQAGGGRVGLGRPLGRTYHSGRGLPRGKKKRRARR